MTAATGGLNKKNKKPSARPRKNNGLQPVANRRIYKKVSRDMCEWRGRDEAARIVAGQRHGSWQVLCVSLGRVEFDGHSWSAARPATWLAIS